MAKGNIAVHTENIFPVIKQWLYSDKDIFARELVSNGCDAISKLKKLVSSGEAEFSGDYAVKVTVDKPGKKLIFSDNGLGMDAEEIEKYITQVAFSGAEEFLEKYKNDKNSDSAIIGHFGLGFYSAFMVAEKVEINSLSYKKGAKPALWTCDGGIEYEIGDGTKETVGTDITLYVGDDNAEFLEFARIRDILSKYCYFLPVDIYVIDAEKEAEPPKEGEEKKEPVPFNDKNPLWLKSPSQCTDEEYKEFYHRVFMDFDEPLFWIHLNVDYPFNLKGILYFPKLKHEMGATEGQVKLYNNQVFVADNIKEVIPEYLLLLKGCIDCPDLPLNVSRSFLQNDGYVRKVSSHITKKVCDKLTGMFNTDRESLEKYWDDINPFVKYGCMRDDSFNEKIKDIVLFKTTEDKYLTLDEYLEAAKELHENTVYYATNTEVQSQYIEMLKNKNFTVIVMPYAIDTHFMSFLEYAAGKGINFKRVDAALDDTAKDSKEENTVLETLFKETVGDESIKIECAKLDGVKLPAVINVSEQSRRMQELGSMMGQNFGMPEEKTLVVNTSSDIVKRLEKSDDEDLKKLVCAYIYDLATLAHKPMTGEQMSAFLDRSNEILSKIGE